MHVATVFEDPGVLPNWSKQMEYLVPVVQVEDTPHAHTLLRQRFDSVSEPHAGDVPHLHVPASQVSVVKVHDGLQSATKRKWIWMY